MHLGVVRGVSLNSRVCWVCWGPTAQSCPRPLQCVAPALTAALTPKLRQLYSSFWEVPSRNFNVVNDLKCVGTTVDRLL